MNLSDQVCDLELAKKLKELRVKQDSLFYYQNHPYSDNTDDIVIMIKEIGDGYNSNSIINTECETEDYPKYSAFTASELLDLLPLRITTKENSPFNSFRFRLEKSFFINQNDDSLQGHHIYIVNYYCDSTECVGEDAWLARTLMKNIHDENPANALAKTLIFLIENEYMEK